MWPGGARERFFPVYVAVHHTDVHDFYGKNFTPPTQLGPPTQNLKKNYLHSFASFFE